MAVVTRTPRSPRAMLIGDRPLGLTGRGSRVLLVDSGIDPALDWGGRLVLLDEDPAATEAADRDNSHAYRGATLCAGGGDATAPDGTALGIAPEAEVLSARYAPLAIDGYADLLHRALRHRGRVDVMAHAYSAREDHELAHAGRAHFALVADADPEIATTVIAAAGHDGTDGVRFPASNESVLAVGTCDEDGRISAYCSVDGERRKPELLVPDVPYLARLEDGQLHTMSGTSAASNLVAGLAALWCQRLRELGTEPVPALVRAALLASSSPSPVAAHRIAAVDPALRGDAPMFAWYGDGGGEPGWRHQLRAPGGHTVRVCAVARRARRSARWTPAALPVTVRVAGDAGVQEVTGDGWVVLELAAPPAGARVTLEVTAAGPIEGMAVVAVGATGDALPRPARRTPRARVVVGISASHDESACVIRDGRLECAIQLERLSRTKHDGHGFLHTRDTVDYCLQALGLHPREVDVFAFNQQPVMPGYVGLSVPTADAGFELFDAFGDRAMYVSHHLAHAFSAFFASPFERAAVLIADGTGGSTIGADDLILRGPAYATYLAQPLRERPQLHVASTYVFGPEGYRLVERETAWTFNPRCGSSSLGEVYGAVSQYIFGDWQEGSGKLMGLAPYGDPEVHGPSFLFRDPASRLQFRADWKNQFRQALHRLPPQHYRHLAARIQRDLEEALLDRMRRALDVTGLRSVAYAGGIALNSVANERMRAETGLAQLFVLPASNDAGIAVGAAAAADYELTGKTARAPVANDFHGYAYTRADCERALHAHAGVIDWAEADLDDVTTRLEAGQIIGLFEGGAELGPRALGHRSILADPRRRETWQYLNRRIKFREDFRPFAPAVAEERMTEFFEMTERSPFMLRVVKVRPEYRDKLGAVTHVDGSARVQTVSRTDAPRFHELLSRFGARTGIPILVNTSLNVRGEAIVETPLQAIDLLLATHLDGLVLGPFFVRPKPVAATLDLTRPVRLAPACALISEAKQGQLGAYLRAGARGNLDYELDEWAFRVLAHADDATPLARLFQRFLPPEVPIERARQVIEALVALRLVLPVHRVETTARGAAAPGEVSVRSPRPAAEATVASAASWPGMARVLDDRDHAALDPTTLRIRPALDTLAWVSRLQVRLGVTRLASVTGYDLVGIPVAAAVRPMTSLAQITATQGKGMTETDALVSALMEGVERFSASAPPPLRRATVGELAAAGAAALGPEALGAPAVGDAVIEWICGASLRSGQDVWLPAAEVVFPYVAPAGVVRPMRPCTTGIASGNTRAEAAVQALCEVIERDAASRYFAGAPAPLLELDAVGDPEVRALVQRFVAAGVQLYVVDLTALAQLPVYMAATWSGDGSTPPSMICGQGAHILAHVALRRALLEAAQSRVVSIQGSREDLIRHASDQQHTSFEEAHALWEAGRALAAGAGLVQLPRSEPPPATVAAMLAHVLGRLEAGGYVEAVITDLTRPELGVPVVHAAVPGLIDSFVDPARRRRRAG
jgi:carbamoyltransferase